MQTDGKQTAVALLQNKQTALRESGQDRLPQRSDFAAEEVVQIKAHLGPWPRALEAAGLKPPRDDQALAERRLAKRIAAKRRKTAEKIRRQSKRSISDEGEKSQ